MQLASSLAAHGVGLGDTVAVLAPNIPAVLEAHYGVPMCGGVLCTLNTRLDAASVAYMLTHSEAKVLIVDKSFRALVQEAQCWSWWLKSAMRVQVREAPGSPPTADALCQSCCVRRIPGRNQPASASAYRAELAPERVPSPGRSLHGVTLFVLKSTQCARSQPATP